MIHKMAKRLSCWCADDLRLADEERQIIQYGVEVFLDGIIKVVVLLITGGFLGCLLEFALSLLAFCTLRYWAGGAHCKTSARCLGAMLLMCLISTYGGKLFGDFSESIFGGIAVASYLMLFFGAPGLTEKSLYMTASQMAGKRIGALIWVSVEYGIVLAVHNVRLKWCIVIAIAIEVFSIIPCWRIKKDIGGRFYVQKRCGKNCEETGGGVG